VRRRGSDRRTEPMRAGERYSLREFISWTRRDSYWILAIAIVPTVLFVSVGWRWLAVPWVPIALIGTATAFIVGFRNNATYARMWEARQIYGAIVNTSRTWALMVLDFVQPCDGLGRADVDAARRALLHRHIAWLTALRFQLRQPRAWESMGQPQNVEYREKNFTVDELRNDLGTVLGPLLPAAEHARVMAASNRATHLIALQGEQLASLFAAGAFSTVAHQSLEGVLAGLYEQQGKCERIKNFPYPRQFASINLYFVRLFTILIPFGLLGEFAKLGDHLVWLTIPFSFLIGWVFNAMERVGQGSENPFEGNANDVPITALSRTIEIDLREMLHETEIPPPLTPVNRILL
jgi:ion channel-forming bestrophin family protein